MPHVVTTLLVGFFLAAVAGWLWRRWRVAQRHASCQLAMLEFEGLQSELELAFLEAAAASGKPRGLVWKQCELDNGALFAEDRANGELYALVGATISFEALVGGDMEDVEAVGNLRFATALFVHRLGRWTTDGRVVFNLEPRQTLERYEDSLASVVLDRPANQISGTKA